MRIWHFLSSFLAFAALMLALIGTRDTQADDWPQWRGPHRDGISAETKLLTTWPENGPKVTWKTRGIGRGYSSVSVAGGKIYTMGDMKAGCFVYCLDEKTGKRIWAQKVARAEDDGPRSTPTVDGNHVYALSRQGILVCLDTADGKVLWNVDFKKDLDGEMMSGWDYSESPLIDGDKLVCTPGSDKAAIVALDKKSGRVLWKAAIDDCGGAGYASIVMAEVADIRQYITHFGNCIASVRADDGTLLWRYSRTSNDTANIPTPVVWNDLVFTTTGYNAGAALLKLVADGSGGIEAREQYFLRGDKLQNHHGGVIRVGEHIYGGHGHGSGRPFCLHMRSGKMVWGPERSVGSGSAAVAYADGHLYFRYEDGTLVLIEATPKAFRVKSAFELPGELGTPGWAHPVIANGKLYIRGNDVLVCYDVRQ